MTASLFGFSPFYTPDKLTNCSTCTVRKALGPSLFSRSNASAVFAAATQVHASTAAQTWDFSAGEA